MQIAMKRLEGRDHFVVPMVMITEGVHIGSQGPLYYPSDVLRNTARRWNGKPIVVYHPSMQSSGYADSPEVFSEQKIGTIFNTRFDRNRLKAEAWIDAERVQQVDIRVYRAIQNRKTMEVSTGLVTSLLKEDGTFNGRDYPLRVDDIIPDHLAVLPDKIGACSIADGAGLIRNALAEESLPLPSLSSF